MVSTDLPNLSNIDYGRAEYLKREIAAFVSYAQMHPTSATAFETWWLSMLTPVNAALAAASP